MEVERATCVAPATCVALPGGVKISLIVGIVCQKFQNRHRVLKSAVFWRKNSLKVTINAEMASF